MEPIYRPGTSWIHRLHPRTKLLAALLAIVAVYTVPTVWLPLGLLLVIGVLAASAGAARPLGRAALFLVLPIGLSVLIIQGILFPPAGATALVQLGPVAITGEGLLFAAITVGRLAVLACAMLLVLLTTHPADLVSALAERGLPRSLAYVVLVALQIVPDMSARATAILDAQRSRGLETQGGLRRFTAIVPLLGPLVVGALLDVDERAMAIESRAYTTTGPKTSLRQLHDSTGQKILRLVMILGILALIGSALYRWWLAR